MNRIDAKFKQLKKLGRRAFIPYITAGDPSLAATGRMVGALELAGADIVELGVPFSDPVADGPTIQAASQRALAGGATLRKILGMVRSLRRTSSLPLVLMTYYNPVFKYGVKDFFRTCGYCGVDGVIIPDLPPEEAGEVSVLGKRYGISVIFLVAPTTPPSRIKKIAALSTGFIYYVSLTGVTGARSRLPSGVAANVRRIKELTSKPVAVGFGISSGAQARLVASVADGVIVGSAIVKIIASRKDASGDVLKFSAGISRAVHGLRAGKQPAGGRI